MVKDGYDRSYFKLKKKNLRVPRLYTDVAHQQRICISEDVPVTSAPFLLPDNQQGRCFSVRPGRYTAALREVELRLLKQAHPRRVSDRRNET